MRSRWVGSLVPARGSAPTDSLPLLSPQAQAAVYRAEIKRLQDELEDMRQVAASPTPSSATSSARASMSRASAKFFRMPSEVKAAIAGLGGDKEKDGPQGVAELHRITQSLTESVHDKDMQLQTQRDMNRRLLLRIGRLEKLVRDAGVALREEESEAEDDDDMRDSSVSGDGGDRDGW